ncbi:MAG: PDZ domain-containing protein [Clostridiales bacterium]|jgi:carboxyl-terminal processing protease|nr:PDZ domain-containing protein [Clostridiales bacterium]
MFGKKGRKPRLLLAVALAAVMVLPRAAVVKALPEAEQQVVDAAAENIYYVMKILLEEYVGRDLTPKDLYQAAMRGMSGLLDEYSQYMPDDEMTQLNEMLTGSTEVIGVVLQENAEGGIEVESVLPGSSAESGGIQKGDVILKINGMDLRGLAVSNAVSLIANSETSEIVLELARQGEVLSLTLEKTVLRLPSIHVENVEELTTVENAEGIGYVYISVVGEETARELREVIASFKDEGKNKLILDMRGNPGGLLGAAEEICKMLVPEGPIVHMLDKYGEKHTLYSEVAELPFEKMAVLIDGETASAAEIIASAMQDSGTAVVVGRQSYGKGVIQTLYALQWQDGFKFTTMEYFRRNGDKINGIGVIPDIVVPFVEPLDESAAAGGQDESRWAPELWEILKSLGYDPGPKDAAYSEALRQAVERFQNDRGISGGPDLTAETIRVLNEEYSAYFLENDVDVRRAVEVLGE